MYVWLAANTLSRTSYVGGAQFAQHCISNFEPIVRVRGQSWGYVGRVDRRDLLRSLRLLLILLLL